VPVRALLCVLVLLSGGVAWSSPATDDDEGDGGDDAPIAFTITWTIADPLGVEEPSPRSPSHSTIATDAAATAVTPRARIDSPAAAPPSAAQRRATQCRRNC
jgi:hypothetical protein